MLDDGSDQSESSPKTIAPLHELLHLHGWQSHCDVIAGTRGKVNF